MYIPPPFWGLVTSFFCDQVANYYYALVTDTQSKVNINKPNNNYLV